MDVDIVKSRGLKSFIIKGDKFRERRPFYWRQNVIAITNSFEIYVRQLFKFVKKGNLIPCQIG
jgi:hypothetical protein